MIQENLCITEEKRQLKTKKKKRKMEGGNALSTYSSSTIHPLKLLLSSPKSSKNQKITMLKLTLLLKIPKGEKEEERGRKGRKGENVYPSPPAFNFKRLEPRIHPSTHPLWIVPNPFENGSNPPPKGGGLSVDNI